MSAFGTVQVGRMVLREDRDTSRSSNAQSGQPSIKLTGQQSHPSLTSAQVEQQGADIASSLGLMVPVVFTEKTNLNGYYTITDWSVDQSKYVDDGANLVPWTISLDLLGTDTEIDLESRLGGNAARSNGFAIAAGERWHAPAGGAYAYFQGANVLASIVRTGVDGPITVYRAVPAGNQFSRWGCPVAGYSIGRARFLSVGVERTGVSFPTDVTNWELNNSLVRVKPLAASGVLEISAFRTAYHAKNYDVLVNGSTVRPFDSVTCIYNDFNRVTIRLTKTIAAVGRFTVDLTVRRGSRVVEVYMQSSSSCTMKFVRTPAEASTLSGASTYISATAADGNAEQFIMGSSQTFTQDLANGGISKAGVVAFDAYAGVTYTGAATGDTAATQYLQYLGTPTELLTAVRR